MSCWRSAHHNRTRHQPSQTHIFPVHKKSPEIQYEITRNLGSTRDSPPPERTFSSLPNPVSSTRSEDSSNGRPHSTVNSRFILISHQQSVISPVGDRNPVQCELAVGDKNLGPISKIFEQNRNYLPSPIYTQFLQVIHFFLSTRTSCPAGEGIKR